MAFNPGDTPLVRRLASLGLQNTFPSVLLFTLSFSSSLALAAQCPSGVLPPSAPLDSPAPLQLRVSLCVPQGRAAGAPQAPSGPGSRAGGTGLSPELMGGPGPPRREEETGAPSAHHSTRRARSSLPGKGLAVTGSSARRPAPVGGAIHSAVLQAKPDPAVRAALGAGPEPGAVETGREAGGRDEVLRAVPPLLPGWRPGRAPWSVE